MSEYEKFTVRVPKYLIRKMDELVESDDLSSRSQVVRTAVRDMLYANADRILEFAKKSPQ